MKLLDFIKYVLKSTFKQIFEDVREIFQVVTKKKTWVFACFLFLIVSLFLKQTNLIILAFLLFLFFFITYQWQVFNDEYKHQQRERYWPKVKK